MTATPNNEAVGVDMPAIWHRLGWAEAAASDDWRVLVREAREAIETLWNAQQPAQAAPGDVAARQAWFAREIDSAESRWIDSFQDRFDAGDDVPGKDYFVALCLAERAPPPPADAEKREDHVAWALLDPMGGKPEILTCKERPYSLDNWLPLYATPPASVPVSEVRTVVLAVLNRHTTEMEGYGYYSSNPGVPEDSYEEIADEIVAALAQEHGK